MVVVMVYCMYRGAERIADVLVENLEVDTGREALTGGGEHGTAQPPSCQKSSTSG